MRLSRQFWVVLHRWAGLTIALFLTIAGLTGALLAFEHELEPLVAPAVFDAKAPVPGSSLRDPFELRDSVLARYPDAVITEVALRPKADRSMRFSILRFDPATRTLHPYAPDWDEVFVDPYSGRETGRRLWGDIRQGPVNLFPFLDRLHHSLALGDIGRMAFGIAALIWTIDCFVGFYLTWPPKRRKSPLPGKAWLARWRPSWRVRWLSTSYKRTFDLHRAGGLWIWPMLLVFAWSGVAFNLPQVYDPVMRIIGYQPIAEGIVPPAVGGGGPGEDMRAAAARGQFLAMQAARAAGVEIDRNGPASIIQYPQFEVYLFRFTSEASVSDTYGDSMVIFSARTGGPLKTVLPRRSNIGMSLNAWLEALHYAAVWGTPYKMLVSLIGLMVTMVSVTGVIIWTKKRTGRRQRAKQRDMNG